MTIQQAKTSAINALQGWVHDVVQPLSKKSRLIRRVIARKRLRAASPYIYTDSPALSLVIHSFNHRTNIERIVDRLRRTVADELIVCEDGSVDGSEKAWQKQLNRPNDFLILSNDIHEIRTYNRAISLARGEFVCVLQDDDIPPENSQWVGDAITLFRAHPKLAILGCWNGWMFDFSDFEKFIGSPIGHGVHGVRFNGADCNIAFTEPASRLPFQFVEAVGIGPMFFRRAAFEALGWFDLCLSGPGEPGIWLDYELCLRAWCSGWHVAVFDSEPFERNVGGQGTMMFTGSKRTENFHKNLKYVERTYADRSGTVRGQVNDLNMGLAPRGDNRHNSSAGRYPSARQPLP